MNQSQHQQWQGRTDGSPFMQRALIAILRFVPVEIIYLFMSLTIPFYIIFRPSATRAIYHFFRCRIGYSRLAAAYHTILNHLAFGQVVVDRFASFAGQRFRLTLDGYDHFLNLSHQPSGFMILSAHVGNFEMAGYGLHSDDKEFYAISFAGESNVINQGRTSRLSSNRIHLLPVSNDLSHIFAINNALDNGDIVSMPADRNNGSGKQIACRFFNAEAAFPLGPFATAIKKDARCLVINVVKRGLRHYHIYVTPIHAPNPALPQSERIAILAQEYADALESVVRRHPNQWYNYYEFWNE